MSGNESTQNNPPWASHIDAVKRDPNELRTWDALLASFDAYLKLTPSLNVPLQFKKEIYDSYLDLVNRYPLLSSYWRVWLVIEYNLNGVDSSIKILSIAVSKFPRSIELWRDFLAALISQYESSPGEDILTRIRSYYQRAISLNGFHFNGHPLWDTIIAFETKLDPQSHFLLKLYSQVTQVPCYEYARYYSQFSALKVNFAAHDIVPASKHDYFAQRYHAKTIQDLSQVEQRQAVDEYTLEVFLLVQQLVTEKWEYESLLLHPDFSPQQDEKQGQELQVWLKYLRHEINRWKTKNKGELEFNMVASVFERALIPHCWKTDLWLKYLAFLNASKEESDSSDLLISVYERSISLTPLDQVEIRLNYARFLLGRSKQDEATEYLLDLVKSYNQEKPYLRKQACSVLMQLLMIWKKKSTFTSFVRFCETVLSSQLDIPSDEDIRPNKKRNISMETEVCVKQDFITALIKLLNIPLTATVVVFYLESLLESGKSESITKVRKFFNDHCRNPMFASFTRFWKLFMDLEGIIDFNAKNVDLVFRYIVTESSLSKQAVDAFTDYMCEIVCANYASFGAEQRDLFNLLINEDNAKSHNMLHNQFACTRMAKHNHLLAQDYKAERNEHEFLRLVKKHVVHPGSLIDATPEITNTPLRDGHWIKLNGETIEPLPLPTFKNVERANAQPKILD